MTVLRFFVRNIEASVPPVFRFLSKEGKFETTFFSGMFIMVDEMSRTFFDFKIIGGLSLKHTSETML